MRDWATSGRVKIERAKEHIGEFASAMTAFYKAHPHRLVGEIIEEDGLTRTRLIVREGAPIPLRWSAIASDATHNLRSSLDILWRQVMYPHGGGSLNTFFPICDSAENFGTKYGRQLCRQRAGGGLTDRRPRHPRLRGRCR